jgi:hypothetical protein
MLQQALAQKSQDDEAAAQADQDQAMAMQGQSDQEAMLAQQGDPNQVSEEEVDPEEADLQQQLQDADAATQQLEQHKQVLQAKAQIFQQAKALKQQQEAVEQQSQQVMQAQAELGQQAQQLQQAQAQVAQQAQAIEEAKAQIAAQAQAIQQGQQQGEEVSPEEAEQLQAQASYYLDEIYKQAGIGSYLDDFVIGAKNIYNNFQPSFKKKYSGYTISTGKKTSGSRTSGARFRMESSAPSELTELGVNGSIQTKADLAKAYREKAKATHPDAGGNAEEFKKVNNAYSNIKKSDWYNKLASEYLNDIYKVANEAECKSKDKNKNKKAIDIAVGRYGAEKKAAEYLNEIYKKAAPFTEIFEGASKIFKPSVADKLKFVKNPAATTRIIGGVGGGLVGGAMGDVDANGQKHFSLSKALLGAGAGALGGNMAGEALGQGFKQVRNLGRAEGAVAGTALGAAGAKFGPGIVNGIKDGKGLAGAAGAVKQTANAAGKGLANVSEGLVNKLSPHSGIIDNIFGPGTFDNVSNVLGNVQGKAADMTNNLYKNKTIYRMDPNVEGANKLFTAKPSTIISPEANGLKVSKNHIFRDNGNPGLS